MLLLHGDVRDFRQPIAPLELDVLDNTRSKTLAPARIDHELPADPRVLQAAFGFQSCLLEQFAPRRRFVVMSVDGDLAPAHAGDCIQVGDEVVGAVTSGGFGHRTGVNIAMYALTGNYKADQVHVPALLERLGQ